MKGGPPLLIFGVLLAGCAAGEEPAPPPESKISLERSCHLVAFRMPARGEFESEDGALKAWRIEGHLLAFVPEGSWLSDPQAVCMGGPDGEAGGIPGSYFEAPDAQGGAMPVLTVEPLRGGTSIRVRLLPVEKPD